MRWGIAVIVVALLLLTWSEPAAAQIQRPVVGAAVGVAGGAVVTLSAIVARAQLQKEYIESADDLIHWQSIPMIAAPAAGVVFGLAGHDAHVGSIIGSSSGMLLGSLVGSAIGWSQSTRPEAPWAGAVIGAGVGLTIGGLAGGLLGWSRDDDPDIEFPSELRLTLSVPAP